MEGTSKNVLAVAAGAAVSVINPLGVVATKVLLDKFYKKEQRDHCLKCDTFFSVKE